MVYRATPNLPCELLSLIFEFSYHAARKSFTPYGKSILEMSWDSPLLTPNLFPFNFASVCLLWRDILAQVPAYWTRLRFDVDHKPVLPTDAVLWARGQPFEVLVLGESPIDISPIAAALLLNIHHCGSIKYDVECSSSLPHFTKLLVLLDGGNPQLHSIKLGCKRDDSGKRISALPRNFNPPPLINFYNLEHLMLPCRMLLDTCREHPCWYERLLTFNLCLTLSQYHFHSPEPEDYNFQELIGYLEEMSVNLFCVYLRDLSLGCPPRSFEARAIDLMPLNVEMHNVDSALINTYFMPNSGLCHSVTFDGCFIPHFDRGMGPECDILRLHNIADRSSLFNTFDAWRPSKGTATIDSCPFFNDDLLEWLSKPQVVEAGGEPMFRSGCLQDLVIIDCPNFTAQGLCQMLRTRAHSHSAITQPFPLRKLSVSGQVPTPAKQDAEWLLSRFWGSLEWKVMGRDGSIKYDIKREPFWINFLSSAAKLAHA